MTDINNPRIHKLVDPETGQAVHLIYAIPPELSINGKMNEEEGLSITEFLKRLRKNWQAVVGITLLAGLAGLIVALSRPDRYTATAVCLPPSEKGLGGGMLSQYAGLAAAAGIQLPSSPSSSVDAIMAILSSRSLHESLIDQFSLRPYYHNALRDTVASDFDADFNAQQNKKTTTISISYMHEDPTIAADIANAAASLLRTSFNEITQASASRDIEFLSGRLRETEVQLAAAAKELAKFQIENGAIEIESQTKATIEAVARLQGELIAQQVELTALLASAVNLDNPKVQLLQERIKAMTVEVQQLVGVTGDGMGVLIGLGSLPELGIKYVERYRSVRKHESIIMALTSQLEAAKISAVRTSEVVTIIDHAYVPDRKSGPARSRIVIISIFLGLILGSVAAAIMPLISPIFVAFSKK